MIVFIAESLGSLNGAALAAANIADALAEADEEVVVLSKYMDRSVRFRRPERVRPAPPPHPVRIPWVPRRGWLGDLRNTYWEWGRARARYKYLRGLHPDVTVLNQYQRIAPLCAGMRRFGVRVGVNHDSVAYFADGIRHFRGNLEERVRVMETCAALVFVSEVCRREWLSLGHLAGRPSFYIPNTCREDEVRRVLQLPRAELRARYGWADDQFVVVCVASIQQRKGQSVLLDHLPSLVEVVPHLIICLVGPMTSEPEAENIRRRVESSESLGRVRMTGARRDTMEMIYAADALVMPSRAEAQGISILEAMVLGTPVIAAEVDGIPEMVEHGVTGFLFSHARSDSLAEAFRLAATQGAQRESCVVRARAKYWQRYSAEQQVCRWCQAIRSVRGMSRGAKVEPPRMVAPASVGSLP